jgi:hypothetical protein
MPSTTRPIELPTEQELEERDHALQAGRDGVEDVSVRAKRIVDAYDDGAGELPDPLPTLEQIGGLALFAHWTKRYGEDLLEQAAELERLVGLLGNLRLDAGVRAAA